MTSIINHAQSGTIAPGIGQPVCRDRRADHVMPPLNDVRGQMPDHLYILQDMIVRHETVIDEIMRLEPRHAQRHQPVTRLTLARNVEQLVSYDAHRSAAG